jgi:hypothetical protein
MKPFYNNGLNATGSGLLRWAQGADTGSALQKERLE